MDVRSRKWPKQRSAQRLLFTAQDFLCTPFKRWHFKVRNTWQNLGQAVKSEVIYTVCPQLLKYSATQHTHTHVHVHTRTHTLARTHTYTHSHTRTHTRSYLTYIWVWGLDFFFWEINFFREFDSKFISKRLLTDLRTWLSAGELLPLLLRLVEHWLFNISGRR